MDRAAKLHLKLGKNAFFAEPPRLEAALEHFREAVRMAPDSAEAAGWLSHRKDERTWIPVDPARAAGH